SLEKTVMGRSDSASSDNNYVPTNPVSDILMSTMLHHFASQGSEIQPPPVNIHLKPDQKAKPVPLDLSNNSVISGLPFKSPVTKYWSSVNHTFNSSFSQYCSSNSTQSITNTDSRDSEENYVPMQNPMSSSPVSSGNNSQDPKKSTGNVNYIALDFHPVSQNPHRKPSTSSAASDDRNGQRCSSPQDPPKMPSYGEEKLWIPSKLIKIRVEEEKPLYEDK
ncbi:GRB2-associated-binding protein 2, partial [Cricetulus griseus]